MNNNFIVTKNVYINTALGYYDPTYLLDVGGNTNISGSLLVNNDVSTNGNLVVNMNTVMNDVSMNGNLGIGKNTTINGSIVGLNDVSFNGNLVIGKNTTINGNIVGLYDLSLNGNLNIGKNTILNGNLLVMRDVSFNGNLNVGQNMYIKGVQVTTGPSSQWTDVLNGNLYYTGNVGVGGINPQTTFDVSGTTNLRGLTTIMGNLSVFNDVSFNGNLNIGQNMYIKGLPVTTGASSQWTTIGTNLYYNGSVAIGKASNPTSVLDISGTVTIKGPVYGTTFTVTSDYRIKDNPQPLNNTFNVDKLRPLHYINKLSNKEDLGFIAHEVQEIYPYLVDGEKDDKNQNQSLNYTGLIAILVKEIQELKTDVNNLKKENAEIKSLIDK
jgi:predicted acyltransferase (DUF342 family)